MAKILITGSSGFLGRRLCQLWSNDDALIKVDITGEVDYSIDLCNTKEVRDLVNLTKPDAIIHLAAHSHVLKDGEYNTPAAYEMVGRNVLATFNILMASELEDNIHVILAGSAAEYGDTSGFFPSEYDVFNPIEPYGISKLIATRLAEVNENTTTLRFANLYGPGQRDKFMPHLIKSAMAGWPLVLNGNGRPLRQWLYVDDAVDAIRLARASNLRGDFNIGPHEAVSIRDIAIQTYEIIQEEMLAIGNVLPIMDLNLNPDGGGSQSVLMDSTSASIRLKWEPKVSLDQGLRQTVLWNIERFLGAKK